ncbi:hypothetical protein J6590_042338 [Homalodisca vitripennis]|nr:hypothetical protein J6590_042338 [Homalodisca vitripennis]
MVITYIACFCSTVLDKLNLIGQLRRMLTQLGTFLADVRKSVRSIAVEKDFTSQKPNSVSSALSKCVTWYTPVAFVWAQRVNDTTDNQLDHINLKSVSTHWLLLLLVALLRITRLLARALAEIVDNLDYAQNVNQINSIVNNRSRSREHGAAVADNLSRLLKITASSSTVIAYKRPTFNL